MIDQSIRKAYLLLCLFGFLGQVVVAAGDAPNKSDVTLPSDRVDIFGSKVGQRTDQLELARERKEEEARKALDQQKELDTQRKAAQEELDKNVLLRATWFTCQNAIKVRDAHFEAASESLKRLDRERVDYFQELVELDACRAAVSFVREHGDEKATEYNDTEIAKLPNVDGRSAPDVFAASKHNFRVKMYWGFLKYLKRVESDLATLDQYREAYVKSMKHKEDQEAFNSAWRDSFPAAPPLAQLQEGRTLNPEAPDKVAAARAKEMGQIANKDGHRSEVNFPEEPQA